MVRRSNAEMSEATRAALLEGARMAFTRHGYADAPLEELVRGAGMTKGALYHHFGSKQGLFVAVAEGLNAEILGRVEAAMPAGALTLRQFVDACLVYLEATLEPGVRRILLIDLPAVLGHSATRTFDTAASVTPIAAALQQLQQAGQIGEVDIDVIARLINGALYEAAMWLGEQDSPPLALDRASRALEQLLSGLVASPRPR